MAGLALAIAIGLLLLLARPAQSQSAGYAIEGGWFFPQSDNYTPIRDDGYVVVDDSEAQFWTAFRRFGGVQTVGYPISQRFRWDGFVTQVFESAAFQWRPETGNVEFVNIFDVLSRHGFDEQLDPDRGIPRQEEFAERGLTFAQILDGRLELLDAEPALRAYYEGVSDPLRWLGLPQSRVREFDDGRLRAIRLQRAFLWYWTDAADAHKAGTVQVGQGGHMSKFLGLWPAEAMLPAPPPPPPPPGPRVDLAPPPIAGPGPDATLLWAYPLPGSNYPRYVYRPKLSRGILVIRVGYSEIHAIDALSGDLLWKIADSRKHAQWFQSVVGDTVYVRRYWEPTNSVELADPKLNPTADVLALDISTGEKKWHARDLPYTLHAGFRVRGQRVLYGSNPLIALDSATGRKLWEVEGYFQAATEGILLIGDLNGNLAAIDMESTTEIWRKDFSDLGHVRGSSEGMLFAESDGTLTAIDGGTGTIAWSFEIPGKLVDFEFAMDGLVVASYRTRPLPSPYPTIGYPEEACALDPVTGQALWCVALEELERERGGIGLLSGNLKALLDPRSGATRWTAARESGGDWPAPQVIYRDGVIYEIVNGDISAIDAATNARLWQYRWNLADRPVDSRFAPGLLEAAGGLAIIWTGSGLAALAAPLSRAA